MPSKKESIVHDLASLQHHEYAAIFPMANEDEMDMLTQDMGKHGYDPAHPITLYEGMILDGRNRQAAAIATNETPTFSEYAGDDPLDFVVRENLHRRHLNASQLGLVAGRLAKLTRGGYRHGKSQSASLPIDSPTVEEAATAMKVSPRTVTDGKKVAEKGTPELQRAVEAGDVSVSDAAKIADESPANQRKAIDKVKDGKAKTLAAAVDDTPPNGAETHAADPAADEPSVVPVDGWGIPIQEHAAEAFAARDQFAELIALLKKADRLWSDIAELPGGALLCVPGISINARDRWKHNGLRTAIMNAEDARPTYTVCPYQHNAEAAHPEKCTLCHNLGWVGQVSNNRIPAELIAAAKDAFGVGNV